MSMATAFRSRAAAGAIVASLAGSAAAQFDQAIVMKWADVAKVRYQVVGEYHDPNTLVISGGTNGYADVRDRAELDFIYDQTGGGLVGPARFQDHPSRVTGLRNGAKGCAAPTIKDPYEHFTILKVENQPGSGLMLTTVRKLAAGQVPAVCTGAPQSHPGRMKEEQVQLTVPSPSLLGLSEKDSDASLRAFPKTDTIVVRDGGWTWTYKLTAAR